tara:strand:- start:5792 stop:6916 length:1125 start_codon:yes stop_codon:yes gene_type:complete
MSIIPLISFKEENELFKDNFIKSFESNIEKSEYIEGESVETFEDNIKKYLGVKFVTGVGNGTDALLISLLSLKIKHGLQKGKIIVTSFSFFATSETILQAGFEPIFVDVQESNGNINHDLIEDSIMNNNEIVGILPVHLYGKPCDMENLMRIKNKYNIFLLEDVAQAFGGNHKNKKLGTIGDMGAFSFFPSKILGALGDGGLVATNDEELYSYAKMLKNHGSKKKYENELVGMNSRLDSIQANFLNIKLKKIDYLLEQRKEKSHTYINLLKEENEITLLDYSESVINYFVIRVPEHRDSLIDFLSKENIGTAIYYPTPLPYLKVHKETKGEFPKATILSNEVIALPFWPLMDSEIIEIVCTKLGAFFQSLKLNT